jgi:hypothetical protein
MGRQWIMKKRDQKAPSPFYKTHFVNWDLKKNKHMNMP